MKNMSENMSYNTSECVTKKERYGLSRGLAKVISKFALSVILMTQSVSSRDPEENAPLQRHVNNDDEPNQPNQFAIAQMPVWNRSDMIHRIHDFLDLNPLDIKNIMNIHNKVIKAKKDSRPLTEDNDALKIMISDISMQLSKCKLIIDPYKLGYRDRHIKHLLAQYAGHYNRLQQNYAERIFKQKRLAVYKQSTKLVKVIQDILSSQYFKDINDAEFAEKISYMEYSSHNLRLIARGRSDDIVNSMSSVISEAAFFLVLILSVQDKMSLRCFAWNTIYSPLLPIKTVFDSESISLLPYVTFRYISLFMVVSTLYWNLSSDGKTTQKVIDISNEYDNLLPIFLLASQFICSFPLLFHQYSCIKNSMQLCEVKKDKLVYSNSQIIQLGLIAFTFAANLFFFLFQCLVGASNDDSK